MNAPHAAAFLHALDPTADSWCFRALPDTGTGNGHNYTGTLAEHVAALTVDNAAGRGVFVVVNGGGHKAREIRTIRAVFADLDGAPLEPVLACELPPHIVAESSPGKWHAYWLVDGLALEHFKPAQQSIAARFGSDATVCDLSRVMRLPGFLHRKGEQFLSRIIRNTDAPRHPAAQVLAAFPPVAAPERVAPALAAGVTIETGRHDDMLRLVARVAGAGLSREGVLAAVQAEANEGRWSREFADDEILRAVDGALSKYGSGEWSQPIDPSAIGFGAVPLPVGASVIAPAPRFKLTPASKLLRTPAPLTWLIRNLLLPGTSSMLVAEPSTGKSLLLVDWAACIGLGRAWCGRSTARGLVVILAGEGQHGLSRRLKAWSIHHGVELADAAIVVSERGASLNEPQSLADVVHAIDAAATIYGPPSLVAVDTLHRNLLGDENSAKDTAAYFHAIDFLRVRYGTHVLTVHHSGHGDKDRARGSSSLRAAVDTELLLSVSAGIRTLQMTKQKDGPTIEPMNFALQPVALPWFTDDGTPETSVVLLQTTASAPRVRHLSPVQRLALDTLRECGGDRVPLETWRLAFYERHTGDSAEAKKKAFQRMRRDLVDLGEIEHESDIYRVAGQPGQDRDMSRNVPGQTGHTPLGVSRVSRCGIADADASAAAAIIFGNAGNP